MNELFGKWVVPVRVHGTVDFNLLAIWACPVGNKRADNYIGQVFRFLVDHRGWFRKAPVVAAGDFNSNSQWDENRPGRNHTEVVRLFGDHGLISAYHTHHKRSKEPKCARPITFTVIRTSHFTSTTCLSRNAGVEIT